MPATPPLAPTTAEAGRVLVVDPDPSLRRALAKAMMGCGLEVLTVEDGDGALSLLNNAKVDVVVVDAAVTVTSGAPLAEQVRGRHGDIEVVVTATAGEAERGVGLAKAWGHQLVIKPFTSIEGVALMAQKSVERRRLGARVAEAEQRLEHRERFGELVGSSPRMQQVYRMALGVASTSSTVLLVGENGTGKELIARAIHQQSPRSGRPFLAVNCGALPGELIEHELFGQGKGAQGDTAEASVGLFESAEHGTVFLDEVSELPVAAQVRLLRLLQEGELRRVGSHEGRRLDVRVIAATHVDLKPLIAAGKFREDLYYRLNVIAIRLPPLRQRRDDIALLAHHFVQKYAARTGRDVKRVSVEAMRLLREYRWPGNVRELENVVERAVVMSRGDTIFPGDLPFPTRVEERAADAHGAVEGGDEAAVSPYIALSSGWDELPYADAKERVLDAFHQAYLSTLLGRTGGNVSEAARRAGLDRSNFRRVLKRYGSPIDRRAAEATADAE